MNSKISKWVLLALAVVTVVIAVMYYLVVGTIKPDFDHGNPTPKADLFLNWGYILIGLGVVIAIISAIVAIIVAIMRGVPRNKVISICVVVAALVILFIASSVLSKDWIETELNFFYLTFGFSILAILFSVIYKAVKK